jgi:large subunit ribosomal protein L15
MMNLHTLENTDRERKPRKRVGRGLGSKRGKTCGRGEKGAGSRSGYKRRWGKEGGNMPLFMKIPIRGFSNARFQKKLHAINLNQIDALFEDGEIVNLDTLREKGFISGPSNGIKLLGNGDLTKKVSIQVLSISKGAREKLIEAKISFEVME